jgi:hypothetical protein
MDSLPCPYVQPTAIPNFTFKQSSTVYTLLVSSVLLPSNFHFLYFVFPPFFASIRIGVEWGVPWIPGRALVPSPGGRGLRAGGCRFPFGVAATPRANGFLPTAPCLSPGAHLTEEEPCTPPLLLTGKMRH